MSGRLGQRRRNPKSTNPPAQQRRLLRADLSLSLTEKRNHPARIREFFRVRSWQLRISHRPHSNALAEPHPQVRLPCNRRLWCVDCGSTEEPVKPINRLEEDSSATVLSLFNTSSALSQSSKFPSDPMNEETARFNVFTSDSDLASPALWWRLPKPTTVSVPRIPTTATVTRTSTRERPRGRRLQTTSENITIN